MDQPGREESSMCNLAIVNVYYDIPEALVARSVLEAAGQAAFLDTSQVAQNSWLWLPAIGGIELRTYRSQLEAAREILHVDGHTPMTESAAQAFSRNKIRNGLVFIALNMFLSGVCLPFWARRRKYRS